MTVRSTGFASSIFGNSVFPGTGAFSGAGAGNGIFLMSGVNTTCDVAGSYIIADGIDDDSSNSVTTGYGYTPGNGYGASVTKQGSGTLILSGTNRYAGTTSVHNGVLRVTGNISGSLVDVTANGILTGDGATGPIDNAGTVAPGTTTNPFGVFVANGGLTLEAGALSCFHASGATNAAGQIDASGATIVNGIARLDFSGAPTVGTTYTLLQAPLISGMFAGFETNMPNLDGVFGYTATAVTFTVTANDVIFTDSFEQSTSGSPCGAAFTN